MLGILLHMAEIFKQAMQYTAISAFGAIGGNLDVRFWGIHGMTGITISNVITALCNNKRDG